MAYTDPVGTKIGQVDNANALDALFKTSFSGLVLREFEANRYISKMLRHKWAIKGAKGRTFRLMGGAQARFHARGESVLHSGDGSSTLPTGMASGGYLSEIAQAERTVNLSDCLLAATTLDEVEEIKNEFDAKRDLAAELGVAIADLDERYSIQAIIKASGLADAYTGEPAAGGTKTITNWTASTEQEKMDAFYDLCFEVKAEWDAKKIPMKDRYFLMDPSVQNYFAKNTKILNRDWGGVGSIAQADAPMLAGFKLITSPLFPTADLSSSENIAAEKNDLHDDFTLDLGVFFTPDAAGRVSAKEMMQAQYWDEDTHQFVFKARNIVGHGPVRRECATRVKKQLAA